MKDMHKALAEISRLNSKLTEKFKHERLGEHFHNFVPLFVASANLIQSVDSFGKVVPSSKLAQAMVSDKEFSKRADELANSFTEFMESFTKFSKNFLEDKEALKILGEM